MKIVLNPQYEKYRTFIEEIPAIFPHEGKTIQDKRNTIKVLERNGIFFNVKKFRIPLFINRIIYTFFRKTKTWRSYNYSMEINCRGFQSPEPVAYIEEYRVGLLSDSYYICLQAPYSQEIREFYFGPLEGYEDLFSAFARYTAALHEAGIYHKDYSPGNILIGKKDEKFDFYLVDTNRMRFGPVSLREGCRSFERLFDNDEVYEFIAKEYAIGRNLDIEECIQWTNYYKTRFLKKHPSGKSLNSPEESD